jgi:large subunit ribosomal protein L9
VKVVLRADVDNVGKKGDVLDVADGFGRNYLVPKGLAMVASKGAVAQAAGMRRSRDVKDARDRESAEVVARELVPSVIRIPVKAGAEGRLFGSVTTADVVEAVHAQAGVELDRRRLHLAEPIKSLGTHEVPVKLHADVEFQITVEVVAQGR